MEGEQKDPPIFRSDDVKNSKSHSGNNNFFVKVTKNPLLRWFLRAKKVEEEKPKIVPVAPKPKVIEKPKPQFRTTIRLSVSKLKQAQSSHRRVICVLSFLLVISLVCAGYFSYQYFVNMTSQNATSKLSIPELRAELLNIVESSSVDSEHIDGVIERIDARINLIPAGEERQSLKLYKLFLLTETGYIVEALDYFSILKNESLTEAQTCELYEYRLLISRTSSGLDDEAFYTEQYNIACGLSSGEITDPEDSSEPETEEPEPTEGELIESGEENES